jgi:hypothetical protein
MVIRAPFLSPGGTIEIERARSIVERDKNFKRISWRRHRT